MPRGGLCAPSKKRKNAEIAAPGGATIPLRKRVQTISFWSWGGHDQCDGTALGLCRGAYCVGSVHSSEAPVPQAYLLGRSM